MARIKGVDIPNNKRIEIALTYIYGIGRSLSNQILVHDVNGDDDMNKNDLWLLFAKTGKIEYYLKYKNFEDEVDNAKNS